MWFLALIVSTVTSGGIFLSLWQICGSSQTYTATNIKQPANYWSLRRYLFSNCTTNLFHCFQDADKTAASWIISASPSSSLRSTYVPTHLPYRVEVFACCLPNWKMLFAKSIQTFRTAMSLMSTHSRLSRLPRQPAICLTSQEVQKLSGCDLIQPNLWRRTKSRLCH